MSSPSDLPRRVYSFPHWTQNPFVNMLYLDAQSQGSVVVGTKELRDFVRVVSDSDSADVIHVHWTSPVVQRGIDVADARGRRQLFEETIQQAISRGTRLIWSVHNVFPHDAKFVEEEVALCEFLSEIASRVHILSSRTAEFVGDLYPLDRSKIVRVPHSSYWGVYDQSLTRSVARATHELEDSDVVIGFVGQLRPYKGVDLLIDTVRDLQDSDPSVAILLAGKTDPEEIEMFDRLLCNIPRVIRSHSFIPDAELPRWLRTIDIMALPYRTVLNSGSVALAATYGVPVVTPQQAGFARDFADQSWITTYDADIDPKFGLASAIKQRREAGVAPVAAAEEWARTNTPYEMSKLFTDTVLAESGP